MPVRRCDERFSPLPRLPATLILEGLVTTVNPDGSVNVAPMGPVFDERPDRLLLRPFQTSTTFRNIQRTHQAVFHVHDDVLLIARSALLKSPPVPETFPAERIAGHVLSDCCRWQELRVENLDDSLDRSEILMRIVHAGWLRDFIGFHRARHAVLEAVILATRVHLLGQSAVLAELDRLQSPVDKTASPHEAAAFQLVRDYVQSGEIPGQ